MNESEQFKAMHEAVEKASREPEEPLHPEKSPRSMRLAGMMREAVEHPDSVPESAFTAPESAKPKKDWYTRWEEGKEEAEEKRKRDAEKEI